MVQYIHMEQDEIQYIHQLIAEACCHSNGSLERNKKLTKIISLMQTSGMITRNGQLTQFDYEEVLNMTWIYFCQNLHRFDSNQANVFTWFNSYLIFRIQDRLIKIAAEQRRRIYPQPEPETGRLIDPIERIPDASPTHSLVDEIHQWVESNQNKFVRIHIRNNPDANAYIIIQHRCILDTSWKDLEQQLHESSSTLSNFYKRRCLPLLIQWLEDQDN